MSTKINSEIAFTYITSNKKLTAVAALGVLLGMAVYIFMNSMLAGFGRSSDASLFKVSPHIRIFNEEQISVPILPSTDKLNVIVNPKVVYAQSKIQNPNALIAAISKLDKVKTVSPQVNVNVFFSMGQSQLAGRALGIIPAEANKMFSISATMVEGKMEDLQSNANGILIGSGIAQKLSLRIGDNVGVLSSKSVNKVFKVVGIFQLNNKKEDDSRCYINLKAAQQLLRENSSYVTDINVNIDDSQNAEAVATELTSLTGYKAENWQAANETMMAGQRMRAIIITIVSNMILLIAGFGIYNILNMTVSQKINDIAILKAMGFEGKDVVGIFVTQAITIGLIGVFFGVLLALLMVSILQKVYIGGDIGYFPIDYEPLKFVQGVGLGFFITFLAGYIPARKAAQVDPVSIFRK